DARSAATVRVRESGDVNAEFALANARTYSVSGKITQPDLEKIDGPLMAFALPQDSRTPLDKLFDSGIPVRAAGDGSRDFELRGLLSGVYDLFAVVAPVTKVEAVTSAISLDSAVGTVSVGQKVDFVSVVHVPGRVAATTIQIRDEDLTDVRLSLDP